MSKKIVFILVAFVFVFGFKIVSAEVIINEVMYAPTQNNNYNEWIEIKNNGAESVDLTGLLVCGKSIVPGYINTSGVVSNNNGLTLSSNQIAIITDGGSGTDVYNNFSVDGSALSVSVVVSEICSGLTNSGKTITISGSSSDSVTYSTDSGATGGKSLQLVNSSWIAATPTPGIENTSSDENGDDEGDNNNDDDGETTPTPVLSHSSGSSTTPKPKVIPTYKAKILAPTLAFAGQPVEFNLDVKYGTDTYASGIYFWNFGDGASNQFSGSFKKFTHTYYYPGEYNISLEYYKNNGVFDPNITAEMKIKVVPLTVLISEVGDEKDFFIELSNNADSKINISKWVLSSSNKNFILPKNTIIAGNSSIIISGKVSGFTISDESSLKLSMPDGEIIFDYNSKSAPTKKLEILEENYPDSNSSESETEYSETFEYEENSYEETENDLSKNNLASAPILSEQGNILSKYGFILGLFAFLCVSAVAIYFIRRKSNIVSSSDDFETVDE